MVQIFLNSDILAQIKAIQNNENLKDEQEVIIRAIQNYSKKNNSDSPQQQNSFEDEISNTTFDGHIEMEKIRNTLQNVTSENLIKKLPQHEIYKMPDAGMIHRFHTKILPVKFSLMCLSKMIIEQERTWIDLNDFKNIISSKTKLVSLVHISNTLGTVNPIKDIVEICNTNNIISVIDGAQASAHSVIDVQNINCDFYVLSAHKMYGPTGVGVVYGKEKLLEEMPPYMGGGEMIKEVKFSGTSYNDLPYKFEAGTPNIGDVIGFKEAINYIENLGKDQIIQYEDKLRDYAQKELNSIDGFRIIGNSENKIGIFSFTIENFHYYDLGLLLDAKGIAVRTGHHCTQPLMDKYNLDGTARVSLALYNTEEEVDFFVDSVKNLLNR